MDGLAAGQLDEGAHALRNDIATLRAATRLVDDAEIAQSMAQALDDLQVRIERAVVAARIDLRRLPARVSLPASELQRLGAARASREGRRDPVVEVRVGGGELVEVPGTWAERLVADLLHEASDEWIDVLAAACGATLERDGARVDLHFDASAS
jgi:hypothetical protein